MNRQKLFFAGAIGNAVEVFEAITYAFLQPLISETFFPPHLKENNLLFFLTIILPFLAKPIGGIFFGLMGDLKGRKFVLEISMILSGLSCGLITILPGYGQIGIISFFILISLRFFFGFSMAGEYNNSFLYLAEHAAPESRGYIISWASAGVSFGIFLASISAYLTTNLIASGHLPPWSFRLLFLFSFITLYIGYRARKELTETAEFFLSFPIHEKKKITAICKATQQELRAKFTSALKIIFLAGFATHTTHALILYGPFHLVKYDATPIQFNEALSLIIFYSSMTSLLKPLFGKLSDTIGRKCLLIFSTPIITFLYLFFFFVLANDADYLHLLIFYMTLAFFTSMYAVSQYEIIESLPQRMRSTTNGFLHTIPSIIFGAFSLPYFQLYFDKIPNTPLVILITALPVFALLSFSKEKLFQPTYQYHYPLEKVKVR